MQEVWRIFSYLGRYKLLAIALFGISILMVSMVWIFPKMTQLVHQDVIKDGKIEKLIPYVLIGLGAYILQELFNHFRIRLNNIFEQRAIQDLRNELYKKLQALPMRWFDNKRTGDTMTRVLEDVPAMERLMVDGIEQGLIAILQILVVSGFLLIMDVSMGLAALAPVPFLAMGALLYSRNARHRYSEVKKLTGEMNSILNDNLSGIQQIKSYAAESKEASRFYKSTDKVRIATLKVMTAWSIYSPSMAFLNTVGYVLVLWVGAQRVLSGEVSDTVFLPFFTILSALYAPVTKLHQLNQMAQSARAAAARVFQILDDDEEDHAFDGDLIEQPVRGRVIFNNVNFCYLERENTLNNIQIEAEPGEMIALVGTTGAGKSTIVNLLTRFYEYTQGSISIDGQEINKLNKPSLREQIGYVSQDPFLFNGTVRENLYLAKQGATDEELWQALEVAHADLFVRDLPDQLDSQIGERGVKLSGGEKQRISMARAFLKNPPILILDEATSSVDNTTEKLIQEGLDKLLDKRTAFVIAHRLSTVEKADKIYVLDNGEIIEQGTHQELLSKKGKYYELNLLSEEIND